LFSNEEINLTFGLGLFTFIHIKYKDMSKINRLNKEHPEFTVNLIDLIRRFDPSDSGKFMPFLLKCVNEQFKILKDQTDAETNQTLKILISDGNPIEKYLTMMLYYVIGRNNLYALWEFEQHLANNRIENKDIQNYKTWDDIINAVYTAELKVKEKELRKQVDVIYDDNDWLILKPLSFAASLAYGAGTKWCTASKNNPTYFYDYSNRGVLVYIINRRTGYKVGMFAKLVNHMKKNVNISFWSADDKQAESMELDFPDKIMLVIHKLVNDRTELKPNKYFFGKDELNRMRNHIKLDTSEPEPQAIQQDAEILARQQDAEILARYAVEDDHAPRPGRAEVIGHLNQAEDVEEAEDVAELRVELVNEAMMGVAEEMPETRNDEQYERKPEFKILPKKYVLGPGIEPIDVDRTFKPAPWLTQYEIDTVNDMLKEDFIIEQGHDLNIYAYPNGRVIKVFDKIQGNTITSRRIQETRSGRNADQKFNPFRAMREINYNDMPAPIPMEDEGPLAPMNEELPNMPEEIEQQAGNY